MFSLLNNPKEETKAALPAGAEAPGALALLNANQRFTRVADRESGPKCQTDIHVSSFNIHVRKVVLTWVSIRLTCMSVESLDDN